LKGCCGKKLRIAFELFLLLPFLLFAPPGETGGGQAAAAPLPVTAVEMLGKTVVIDPGHGGSDPGTIGCTGTLEKDVALAISKKIHVLFQQAGAKAILTRQWDQDLGDPRNPDKESDLQKRVEIAQEARADVFISVHLNHFSDRSEYGAQVFYQRGSVEGKKLAECIQPRLNAVLVDSGRQALAGDFYLCRNVRVPAVIVEVGFLSHPEEEKRLQDDEYQARAAWAIYSGVVSYFQAGLLISPNVT
jgi:N-acetylmuramoyl-L-alanine amidase